MKKFFALVLALVMALSLVACGDKKDDGGDVTAEHTDTTTVAVGAVILARDDVSSDDVYKFVADIFDNAASLTTSHAKYGELPIWRCVMWLSPPLTVMTCAMAVPSTLRIALLPFGKKARKSKLKLWCRISAVVWIVLWIF